MTFKTFLEALLSIMIAIVCYILTTAMFIIIPWYLIYRYSIWWLILAFLIIPVSWWVFYRLGLALKDIFDE